MKANPIRRWVFYLAKSLGKTVGEIEAMPALEFQEWVAFEQIQAGTAPQTDDEMINVLKHMTPNG